MRFYGGDIVTIKRGEHYMSRWNVCSMEEYIGKDAIVEYATYGHGFDEENEGDISYKLKGLPRIHRWIWTGEDLILKEKKCFDCGNKIEGEDEIIEGNRLCPDCAKKYKHTCVCCGEKIISLHPQKVSGKVVCNKCFAEKVKYCPNCNNPYFKGEGYVDDYGNTWCSEDCAGDYSLDNEYMKDYCEKPQPVFFGNKDELHLGIELEVDTKREEYADVDDLVQELSHISNKHICKTDGSLGEYGVEIVTMPCTLEYHKNNFGWSEVVEICRNNNYFSDQVSTCGLHIHVDRKYFEDSKEAAVKLTYLIYKFQEQLINFSRRRNGALNDWARIMPITNLEDIENSYNSINHNRYQAVNVTNTNTIEFRLWKGTLNLETIFATMQMTQVLCDIVKNIKDIENVTWEDICNYSGYKELRSYLIRRNLMVPMENDNEEVA